MNTTERSPKHNVDQDKHERDENQPEQEFVNYESLLVVTLASTLQLHQSLLMFIYGLSKISQKSLPFFKAGKQIRSSSVGQNRDGFPRLRRK
jgi:hypothetical protein